MSGPSNFDVFVSYTTTDEAFAKQIKATLQSRGLRVWLACDEIAAGDRFPSAIELALQTSSAVALVVSPESLASDWVREEYDSAIALGRGTAKELRIIPVLLRSADLPPFLASRKWVDFRSPADVNQRMAELAAGIRGKPSARQPAVTRVCFISSEYPPLINGGLGIHVDKLTAALAKHLAVDVLLPDPGKQEYRQATPGVKAVSVRVRASYTDSSSWRRFAEFAPTRIKNLGPANVPDIIHCHDWVTVLAGINCKWRLGIPLVFHMHLPNREPLCAYIENLGLISADLVTVNSEAMLVEISDRKLPIRKLQVVRNGVDTAVFRPADNWPAEGDYILFVGRLVEQKGVEYLLRAFYYVREKFPGIRLKIVGDGEFKEWLERLCENLMLSTNVEFLGWLDHDAIADLYQAARVVVVPSVFEPFGMVALEAFASKRPVVASRVGGLREIVQHNAAGFLAEPKDHLDLAQWIMSLLSDPQLRHRMGEAGLARLQEEGYLWPAVAEQFIELYEHVKQTPVNLEKPGAANGLAYQIENIAHGSEKWNWSTFLWDLFKESAA